MAKFKFKYKRQGNTENKPEVELRFQNGTSKDYAFEVMSLITMLMCVVHEDCKEVYELVKEFMQDKSSPLYSAEMLHGLNKTMFVCEKKKHRKEGDADDEV